MKTALFVLDIQKDFIGDQARMPIAKHQIEPMLKCINTIIEKANNSGIPIIYIGNEFEPKQFILNWFRNNSALKGSQGANLDERLTIVNNIYFSKKTGDALSNSELVSYLHVNDIKHIIIVGVFAEGCVKATANSAIRKNFSVSVVKDAVGSASDKKKIKSLNEMDNNGIIAMDSLSLFEMFAD
ncbi:cysteine hydrolase [Bacillus sp. FJAT-49736]|uniref:cysteine hydrolase n=1 Tax=Bacillus sp. FJAT-49736 TaxID=2833582 RepID=UPI001BC92F46|nr:cysteine hydrolase [Bacillus sp. FJAT-49736]MBS4175124.1 cysteine hydrolase [Bacillus sp. FJAT-49736]